jgi:hypothetical protein
MNIRKVPYLLATGSLIALCSIGCANQNNSQENSPLQKKYMESVEKAALHEVKPAKLIAIPSGPQNIEMTTWTNENIPYGPYTLTEDTWVTITKQMQNSCRKFPQNQVEEKIEEFLGMPPMKSYDGWHFVTMMVPNQQADMTGSTEGIGIFRPCVSTSSIRSNQCSFDADPKSGAYNAWSLNLMADEFTTTDPYPWSGLGYTYNWNPQAKSIVGGSEFLVTKGTQVQVIKSETASEFCQ